MEPIMTTELTEYAVQNWLITPAALAFGEKPPASIQDQVWLLTLSGVVIANLEGNSTTEWRTETLYFMPPTFTDALNGAIAKWNIPKPPPGGWELGFSAEQWAPYVSLSSIYDQAQSIDAGYAVNNWWLTWGSGTDAFTGLPFNNTLLEDVYADAGVRDTDAWVYRVNYNISLRGRIVFFNPMQ
jgi:hypothetical protein